MENRYERESRMSFSEWISDFIEEALDNYEGSCVYGCDLAYKLTEEPNIDGSYTYSSYWAEEFLKNHWEECGEYMEYEKFNFGKYQYNPFEEPEKFQVCMLIWGVENRLSESKTVMENWDNKFELNIETINRIKRDLNLTITEENE